MEVQFFLAISTFVTISRRRRRWWRRRAAVFIRRRAAACPSDGLPGGGGGGRLGLTQGSNKQGMRVCMYAMYRGAAGLTSKIVLRARWNIFKLQSLSHDLSAQSLLHEFDPVRKTCRSQAPHYRRSPFKN